MMKKLAIIISVYGILLVSCNGLPFMSETIKGFREKVIVPENFTGNILVVWGYPGAEPIKLTHEVKFDSTYFGMMDDSVAVIHVPKNGIFFTSTKHPATSATYEFYENDITNPLTRNKGAYSKIPQNGGSTSSQTCSAGQNQYHLDDEMFYVLDRYYTIAEQPLSDSEAMFHDYRVDSIMNIVCQSMADSNKSLLQKIYINIQDRFPEPIRFISDTEKLFTQDEISELSKITGNYEKQTTNRIYIVTTPSFAPYRYRKHFSDELAVEWAVRHNKANDIVIVVSNKLRSVYISTGAEAEKVITNNIAQNIIDSVMLPEFKEKRLYEGVKAGVLEISKRWR